MSWGQQEEEQRHRQLEQEQDQDQQEQEQHQEEQEQRRKISTANEDARGPNETQLTSEPRASLSSTSTEDPTIIDWLTM